MIVQLALSLRGGDNGILCFAVDGWAGQGLLAIDPSADCTGFGKPLLGRFEKSFRDFGCGAVESTKDANKNLKRLNRRWCLNIALALIERVAG